MRIRSAFTLVEMLLVTALIAMIIAMLLPSLSRTREIAMRAICANNLHQLHVGYYTYAIDSARQFPVTGVNNGTQQEGYFIKKETADMLLTRYMGGNVDVYYCPSALLRGFAGYPSYKAQPNSKWWWETWQSLSGSTHRVTGYGSTLHLNPNMPNTLRIRRTSDNPSLTMLYDANEQGWNGSLIPGWSWRLSHDDGIKGPEGANRAQLSGDVKWVAFSEMQSRWHIGGGFIVWW